jgi:hypothetical protein
LLVRCCGQLRSGHAHSTAPTRQCSANSPQVHRKTRVLCHTSSGTKPRRCASNSNAITWCCEKADVSRPTELTDNASSLVSSNVKNCEHYQVTMVQQGCQTVGTSAKFMPQFAFITTPHRSSHSGSLSPTPWIRIQLLHEDMKISLDSRRHASLPCCDSQQSSAGRQLTQPTGTPTHVAALMH